MSVEALAISVIVDEGASALRRFYGKGISSRDFVVWEDEFKWIERRLSLRKPVNRRSFRAKFPEFEWQLPRNETIEDLVHELREERAFEEMNSIVTTLGQELERDNALDLAVQVRDALAKVTRRHAPMSDIDLDSNIEEVIEEMRQGMLLAKQGLSVGIPTGIPHLDHHWGGLMPGILIELLGRTGEGKSYKALIFAWAAKKQGYRVGVFTPELNAHQVRCRYHTLASADKKVQKALGLERSFRNRALYFKRGFNLKAYQRFLEYMESIPGRVHLLSGDKGGSGLTVGYIEDRCVELELDLLIVDPIYLVKPVRTTGEGGWQETAWTTEAVHQIGEQYDIPVVFTNQASDKQKAGRDDAPHRSDSFGSQSMSHLSDYILGLKHVSDENRMICRGTKSRFGADNFRYEMKFYANTGVMRVLTPLAGNYFNGSDDPDEDDVRNMVENAITGKETSDV